jgi:hypothetical protein
LTNSVLPAISARFLEGTAEGTGVKRVHIDVANSDFAYEF